MPSSLSHKRLLLAKAKVAAHSPFAGLWRAKCHGSGLTFSDIRRYVVGDDVRCIDWRTSAKRGTTHIKLYEEERQATVWIALAHTGTLGFGSRGITKMETLLDAMALVASSAVAAGDRVGFVGGGLVLPAQRGDSWAARLLEAAETAPVRKNAVEEIGKTLLSLRARNGLIILFTDSPDILPEDLGTLAALRAKNALIVVRVTDSFEENLDVPGVFRLPNGTILDATDRTFAKHYCADRTQRVSTFETRVASLAARHATLDGTEPAFVVLGRALGR